MIPTDFPLSSGVDGTRCNGIGQGRFEVAGFGTVLIGQIALDVADHDRFIHIRTATAFFAGRTADLAANRGKRIGRAGNGVCFFILSGHRRHQITARIRFHGTRISAFHFRFIIIGGRQLDLDFLAVSWLAHPLVAGQHKKHGQNDHVFKFGIYCTAK